MATLEPVNDLAEYQGISKDAALSQINRGYWDDYLENTVPLEEKLFEQYNNVNTVEQARKDAVTSRRVLGDITNRNKSRYGVTTNKATSAYEDRMNALGQVRGVAKATSDARLTDQDTRLGILSQLMGQGTTLRNNSQQGLGMAARLEAGRNAQYEGAVSNYRNQRDAVLGQVAPYAMAFL